LAANFVMAQTSMGDNAGTYGNHRSAYYGLNAGNMATAGDNVFVGGESGKNATGANAYNNTAVGTYSLTNTTGSYNVAIGSKAGQSLTTGKQNTFIGGTAGRDAICEGNNNTGIGYYSLNSLTTGAANLAIGVSAGTRTTIGYNNVFMGTNAGRYNDTGNNNIYLGANAGQGIHSVLPDTVDFNITGSENIAIGRGAGSFVETGSRNVFIGYKAGKNESLKDVSNQLYIQNSADITTPLIYGDFAKKQVGIGTSDVPDKYAFAVRGHIVAEEVTINLYDADNGGWPDYVFSEDYDLMPLTEIEAEIKKLGHLPGVPSAEEVEENGHALGQMDAILLEKIEELTLHLIDINKEMEKLRERNEETRSSEVEDK